MLEFRTSKELSRWSRNHRREKEERKCRHGNRLLIYNVVDSEMNPEVPVFFGFDKGRGEYYVSEDVPAIIRDELVRLEDTRLHSEGKRYSDAVANMQCPAHKQSIFSTTLSSFLRAINVPMEDTQNGNYEFTEDVTEALKLLKPVTRSRKRAA